MTKKEPLVQVAVMELVDGLSRILQTMRCHRTSFPFNEEPCRSCNICHATALVKKYGRKKVRHG